MTYSISNIVDNNDIIVKVLTYDLEETIDFDLSIFTPERQKILLGFKSKKRQFEYYFSRLLWLSFKLDEKIIYLPSGKPTLDDAKDFASIRKWQEKK